MNIGVEIGHRATNREFLEISLEFDSNSKRCELELDYKRFYKKFGNPSSEVFEFVYFALIIYCVDKISNRIRDAEDNWARSFELNIPVNDIERWDSVKKLLENTISFLTGDLWTFNFCQQNITFGHTTLDARRRRRRDIYRFKRQFKPTAVSLFSGGLDSLVGTIDWLESNPESQIFLIGHHDSAGPESQQIGLFDIVKRNYDSRCDFIPMYAGIKRNSIVPANIVTDNNSRARSLLFISLGILCTCQFDGNIPMLIPENGTIALNVPLTPARRGSLSTRTCHPYFLDNVQKILSGLNIGTTIVNPLAGKTKGQCMEQCLNRRLLSEIAPISVSCGKAGHHVHWHNRRANSCGRCVPCIFRRAALHQIDIDIQGYGFDICNVAKSEIEEYSQEGWNDLRAISSFLKSSLSDSDILKMLIARGPLDINRQEQYVAIIQESMNEIRCLFQDKASDDIKKLVGLSV